MPGIKLSATIDVKSLSKQLTKKGDKYAQAMNRTITDMKRSAPKTVADITTGRYKIAKGEINPNSKRFQGRCSITGGVRDFQMTYRSRMLTVLHFKPAPAAAPAGGRRYTIKVEIIKGEKKAMAPVGKPGSMGGAYSAKSPYMYMGGVKPPMQRIGGTTMRAKGGKSNGPNGGRKSYVHPGAEHKAATTLSIPQMVTNENIYGTTQKALAKLMQEKLNYRLSQC